MKAGVEAGVDVVVGEGITGVQILMVLLIHVIYM
jgi:hypothetical protein